MIATILAALLLGGGAPATPAAEARVLVLPIGAESPQSGFVEALQINTWCLVNNGFGAETTQRIFIVGCTYDMAVFAKPCIMQVCHYSIGIAMPNLDHCTQLFIEQGRKIIFAQFIYVHVYATVCSKCHLA